MDNHYKGVIWTNHAIQRLQERQITQSDAWYTFQHPDGQLPGSTYGSTKFYKDYNQQRIEIVAIRNEKKEWVIMSCWSKIIGTGRPIFKKQENFLVYLLKQIIGSR